MYEVKTNTLLTGILLAFVPYLYNVQCLLTSFNYYLTLQLQAVLRSMTLQAHCEYPLT